MRKAGRLRYLLLLVLPLMAGETAWPQAATNVDCPCLSYTALADLVNKHRGKVVVVDFWATFCPPCVKELPNIGRMHKKFAGQGLVTITVSLDQVKQDPAVKKNVLSHLQKLEAPVSSIILDEDFAFVQKKLRFEGPPCVFVFNRQGKWAEFKEDQFRHELIEQTVIQFLREP